jgi:hypothetical protein
MLSLQLQESPTANLEEKGGIRMALGVNDGNVRTLPSGVRLARRFLRWRAKRHKPKPNSSSIGGQNEGETRAK